MIKKVLLILIVFIVGSRVVLSQNVSRNLQTDSLKVTVVKSKSPISSLSIEEYNAYKLGKGMGMANAALLNNYPEPAQVLELERDLKLSTSQKAQLKSVSDEMHRKALEMGVFILQQEKKLNDLFVSGKINEGHIIYYTNKIGLYQGELRNAYLQAHLKARQILRPDQIHKYNLLQRYSK